MSAIEVASTVAALIAAVGSLTILAIRAERRARRMANRLLGDGQTPGALDRLDDVWAQVHPDHGGSLRDVVDRTDRALAMHLSAPWDQVHQGKRE